LSFPGPARHRLPAPTAAGPATPAPTTATRPSSPASSLSFSSQLEDEGAGTGACAARPAPGGAAGADGAPLGNTSTTLPGNTSTTLPGGAAAATGEGDEAALAEGRRTARCRLRRGLRKITGLERLRKCGKVTRTGTGGPILRTGGGHAAGFAGLTSCGSVWSCPCCAAKVAAERAGDMAVVLEKVHTADGCGYMITLTMRHDRTQPLGQLWDASTKAWGRVITGRGWVEDAVGLLGWAKVTEVTRTPRNGWHVHVHALLCWDHDVDEDDAQRVAVRMWRRWDAQLRRDGLDSTPVHGVHAERVRAGDAGLAEYFVKAAREITSSYAKDSKVGRSPLAIGRDAVETGDSVDVAAWREWETMSSGRKQLTWSTGRRDLRAWAGLRRERTDEEVAAQEGEGRDQIGLTCATWQRIGDTDLSDELRWVADREGIGVACGWLDERGLGWFPVVPRPRRCSGVRSPWLQEQARMVLRV